MIVSDKHLRLNGPFRAEESAFFAIPRPTPAIAASGLGIVVPKRFLGPEGAVQTQRLRNPFTALPLGVPMSIDPRRFWRGKLPVLRYALVVFSPDSAGDVSRILDIEAKVESARS